MEDYWLCPCGKTNLTSRNTCYACRAIKIRPGAEKIEPIKSKPFEDARDVLGDLINDAIKEGKAWGSTLDSFVRCMIAAVKEELGKDAKEEGERKSLQEVVNTLREGRWVATPARPPAPPLAVRLRALIARWDAMQIHCLKQSEFFADSKLQKCYWESRGEAIGDILWQLNAMLDQAQQDERDAATWPPAGEVGGE